MTNDRPDASPTSPASSGAAIVLTGGGARAAYQVGLLRGVGRHLPDLRFPIVTGVSAGAINAAFLAAHAEGLGRATEDLSALWRGLRFHHVFRVDLGWLARNFARWTARLLTGGGALSPEVRGLVSTAPLRTLLMRALRAGEVEIPSIAENVRAGHLRALALSTLNYATGQTEIWIQGSEIRGWERPNRRSRTTLLTVDHVLASASLPLVFPAVALEHSWYGDGGIRMAAPLSPALHLGADRILAISTRYARTPEEAARPSRQGYPVPAQIAGQLLNAIFLDALDRDATVLDRINRLLPLVDPTRRNGLRPVECLVVRPSEDLGRLTADYESRLPGTFRHLTRSLGTRETSSPDFLSLLMFDPEYLQRLMAIGERDAEARLPELKALLAPRG